MTNEQFCEALFAMKPRSAWEDGVISYAFDILDSLDDKDIESLTPNSKGEKIALNGANNWYHYSYSGLSLCYDGDIADRLCTASELCRMRYKEGGFRKPNKNEEWLDTQGRALTQAWDKLCDIMRSQKGE